MKKWIKNDIIREIVDWAIWLLAAFLLFLIVSHFVFRTAKIDGSSMEPTLQDKDLVVVAIFPYLFGEAQYGDIVAFPYPANPSEYYIKRIIGRPGDEIDLHRDGFYVNGELLADNFSVEGAQNYGNQDFPLIVPEGSYFVLGDNRNHSEDSRYVEVGCVRHKDIIGRAVLRFWPFNKLGTLNSNRSS